MSEDFRELHRRLQKPVKKARKPKKQPKVPIPKTAKGYPSNLERETYRELSRRQDHGVLNDICRQQTVELTDAKIPCKVDFRTWNVAQKRYEWHEAKGVLSEKWVIFEKLWHFYGPGILYVWEMSNHGPVVARIITPKSLV